MYLCSILHTVFKFLSACCYLFQVPLRLHASFSSSLLSSTSALSPKTKSPWTLSPRYWWGFKMCFCCLMWNRLSQLCICWTELIILLCSPCSFPGCLFRCARHIFHGDESEFHHHRLDNRGWACGRRPLDGTSACASYGRSEGCTVPMSGVILLTHTQPSTIKNI